MELSILNRLHKHLLLNSCDSDQSSVTNLEIKAKPNAQASNTGAYSVGQTIQLNATGGSNYSWSGPDGFTSNISNPTKSNALSVFRSMVGFMS